MDGSYSLAYYDEIFGGRGPSFYEMIQAVAEQLENYGASAAPALESGDPEAFSRLRHQNLPLVQHLKLTGVQQLEAEAQDALASGRPEWIHDVGVRLGTETRRLAALLISELLTADPGPR